MSFQKVELDENVHIDQKGWSFWLKVQHMEDTN
jgi:hypothetical protein